MHHIRVVFAGEDVAGPAHVGGKLVDFIEAFIYDGATQILVAQIADDEVICLSFGVFVELQIHAADPEALPLQSLDKMAADKTAGAAYQCLPHIISYLSFSCTQSCGAGRSPSEPHFIGSVRRHHRTGRDIPRC